MGFAYLRPLAPVGALLACLATVPAAQAADTTGNYAVRGTPAMLSCTQLQAVLKQGGPPLAGVIAWMDGVVTGVNMSLPNTFDISPYRGGPVVQAMVLQICGQNPQLPVHAALFRAINSLAPFRAQADGAVVSMSANGQTLAVHQDTMKLVSQALIQRGFLRPQRVDGQYTAAVRQALKAFQQAERLPVTELPDPETLLRLVRR